MAGRGPARKMSRSRERDESDRVEVPLQAEQPDLPWRSKYVQRTNDWWDKLADEPVASTFTALDWWNLATIVAPLLDEFYREPSTKMAAELRQHFVSYGLTMRDRRAVGIEVKPAEPKEQRKSSGDEPEGDARDYLRSVS